MSDRKVRLATPSDKEVIVGLLRSAHAEAGFDDRGGITGVVYPFDQQRAEWLIKLHMHDQRAVCLVLDIHGVARGVLMAAHCDHPMGAGKIAKETAWYIDPAYRGRGAMQMLDAYEAWWRVQGCVAGGMAGMGGDPAVGKLYRRRGYRAAEVHYVKVA